jgi:aminoglycoside phosphotransferase (APT) family kinase protein
VAGASWTTEQALPGRRPERAGAALIAEVAEVCARLPMCDGPPTAPVDDLRGAAARLPDRSDPLRALAERLEPALAALPAVQRHGDLWTGNLLVHRGRLGGIVDWDAAHPAGVPGADLVQLHGADARRRAHRPLGAAVLERTWRSPVFASATSGYWRAVGLAPDPATLDLAGIAWWATEVHHTLVRLPQRAADAAWIAANVDAVLAGVSVPAAPPRA